MSQNKTWFFRSNVFLKDLSAAELAVVDARSSVQKIKRKSVLWTHGDPSKHAYWIRNGVVKIFRHAFGGRTHGLDYFTKGDLVGEECIFSESPRTNEAVAYEDVTALAVEKGVFIELGQRKSLVLERIGRSITEKKIYQEQWHSFLLYRTVPARLAGLFLRLAKKFGVRDSRGIILNLKLTHREMAAIIGASRETVSFAILDLRKRGIIQVDGKRVVLVDLDAVQQLLSES